MAIFDFKQKFDPLYEHEVDTMDYQSIMEAYFGSNNKELEALQAQFSIFRSKWLDKGVYTTTMNTDPELLKFNRMVEDFFGFKSFALVVEPTAAINAYTYPLSSRIDVGNTSKHLVRTKNGFKYKKEIGYSCMVFIHSSLIVDSDFTDREIMAIFLHEIGHNFQQDFNVACTVSGIIGKMLNLVYLPINTVLAIIKPLGKNAKGVVGSVNLLNDKVIKEANKLKKNNPEFVEATYFIKKLVNLGDDIFLNLLLGWFYLIFILNPINGVISILYSKIISLFKKNTLDIVLALLHYKPEKVADEFATIYGYGGDLSSALKKMDYNHKSGIIAEDVFTSIPFINDFYVLFTMPLDFLLDPFKSHPRTVSRAKNQLKLLETELTKNGIDPKMKKQIEEDMDHIRKSIDEMTTPKMGDPQSVKKAYSAMMFNLCGGDIRELFNRNNPIGDFDKYLETPMDKVKIK